MVSHLIAHESSLNSMSLEGTNQVTVTVDTIYPFSDVLNTTINAAQAYTHYIRIPSWVSNGTISVNGGAASAVSPTNGLHQLSVPAGETVFTLNLPAEITIGEAQASMI